MNKIAKYLIAAICLLTSAYLGWLVISIAFPIEEWLQQNPEWRPIFNILIVIGVIGFLAGIAEAKRR
jgi:hypothetical protein